MKSFWLKIALAIPFWAFVGLVLSLELYFTTRAMNPGVSFWDVSLQQFLRASLWALLWPVVWSLRKRVSLIRGHWICGILFPLAVRLLMHAPCIQAPEGPFSFLNS